jgi:MFS family permease
MQTGFTTVIPYTAGTIGMLIWGHYSDKYNERRWNLTASCSVMALGCILAGVLGTSMWSIVGLSMITVGLYASNAHLFPLASVFLTGPALATGIAWVNSVGILGGSVSPPIVGWLKDYTGSFTGGLYALAGFGCWRQSSRRVRCARRRRRSACLRRWWQALGSPAPACREANGEADHLVELSERDTQQSTTRPSPDTLPIPCRRRPR